jgi:hypothetical protein
MGNKLTNELPQHIDERLMDIAQMHEGIDYGDIMKFGKKADKKTIKQIKSLIELYEEEEGEEEKTVQTIIDFVLVIIGKKEPIEILRYSETVDNWGRQESSKQPKIIKKVLTSPKNFSDDMLFEGKEEGAYGGFSIEDLEGKIIKTGEFIIAVPFFES